MSIFRMTCCNEVERILKYTIMCYSLSIILLVVTKIFINNVIKTMQKLKWKPNLEFFCFEIIMISNSITKHHCILCRTLSPEVAK